MRIGSVDTIRLFCRERDADLLRARESQPLVYLRLCDRLRLGLDLRIPAGRLAVRPREAIWALVALRRWWSVSQAAATAKGT